MHNSLFKKRICVKMIIRTFSYETLGSIPLLFNWRKDILYCLQMASSNVEYYEKQKELQDSILEK